MNFWIASAIAFVAWSWLYGFVDRIMNDLGIGWIKATDPCDAHNSLAVRLTVGKRILFAVLMIAALVLLAQHYPSHRNWSYGLGLLWSVWNWNGLAVGIAVVAVIVALWSAGV